MADVTVYASNTCPHCTTAKNYLKDKNIPFTEKNVSTDEAARNEFLAKGHRGVPVIVIDGQEIVGFNQPEIDRLLNI